MSRERQHIALPALVLILATVTSCGEVFSDYELKAVTVAEPVLQPQMVLEQSTTWLEVHVGLDGGTASVQLHEFDGSKGITLAFDDIGFFPGMCPTGVVSATSIDSGASSSPGDPFDDEGRWVFCTAIEVGPFEASEVLRIRFTFWNGLETVKGVGTLAVHALPNENDAISSGDDE
ncbi:MAG: hypothetical protein VX223_02780 [Myxococcota bacterium]|nr:hypothetical protein [Myxococcota bacterium]